MGYEPFEGIAPPESDPAIALEMREEECDDCVVEHDMHLSTLNQMITRELVEYGDELLRVRISVKSSRCITIYRKPKQEITG